jgi:hypothetical protein
VIKMPRPTVAELDKKIEVVKAVLHRLENNHLVHMQKDIDKLDIKVWAILGGIALQLAATVIALVVAIS